MAEGISYKLEVFEGPLDLLLHHIDKDKINIYDIPIAEITEQYLEYMHAMPERDLNTMSDFLVMAATLLDIKARMLLPKEVDPETGEEVDPRAELVERLIEHRKYKMMAARLAELQLDAEKHLYKNPTVPKEVQKYEPPVDMDSLLDGLTLTRLQSVFDEVMKRSEDRVDTERSRFGTIRKERISVKQKVESLISYAKEHRSFSFRNLLENQKSRLEIVVTFLSVLELTKIGLLQIAQEDIRSDIMIETADAERLAAFDLSELGELE